MRRPGPHVAALAAGIGTVGWGVARVLWPELITKLDSAGVVGGSVVLVQWLVSLLLPDRIESAIEDDDRKA